MKKKQIHNLLYLKLNGESKWSIYYVFQNKNFTPFRYCVEYEDYYEIAMFSFDLRINKATNEISSNRIKRDMFDLDLNYSFKLVKK